MPRSARAATRVACVSRATADDVQRLWGVPEERIRIVPNGVDARFTPGDGGTVARRHGIEGPYVLHVGALEPRKGLDVLIEAAARDGGWQLVLAGQPGHEGERILGAARAVGAAWLGEVDDDALARLYRAAEVVAVPSLYEGFGIVPLEAMASATPAVVAADAGALGEVAGAAAIQVGERTGEAWAAAIASARERRAKLTAAGLERAAEHRWPRVAEAVRGVLAEAAAGKRAAR
jgi:glycosyltransferase involved in cell wall biosynthesis